MLSSLLAKITTILIDKFLLYPVISSTVLTCVASWVALNNFWKNQWEKIATTLAIFVLLTTFASAYFIPVLSIAPERIILRIDRSCSTFERPTRYICLTFDVQRQPLFYTTTWRHCSSSDPNMKNATTYYVISSWIPSFDDFVTTQSVVFQPESTKGENKPAYTLPEGYCVRAAGPSGLPRQRVSFTSISLIGDRITDSGYINSSLLQKFSSGWYRVSSCSSELSRWWYNNCTLGYVSSYYVRLPESVRTLLLEGRDM